MMTLLRTDSCRHPHHYWPPNTKSTIYNLKINSIMWGKTRCVSFPVTCHLLPFKGEWVGHAAISETHSLWVTGISGGMYKFSLLAHMDTLIGFKSEKKWNSPWTPYRSSRHFTTLTTIPENVNDSCLLIAWLVAEPSVLTEWLAVQDMVPDLPSRCRRTEKLTINN